MIEEVDHSEIESLKADQRHKELLATLKGLAPLLAKLLEPLLRGDNSKEFLQSMQKNYTTMDMLARRVQAAAETRPQVTVDLKSVAAAISELAGEVKKINAPKAEKSGEYEFEIVRNPSGFIQSVNAKIKNK